MRLFLLVAALLLAAPYAEAQNRSLNPTYGSVTLARGFTPDPHSIELTAGGSQNVTISGCAYGRVANAPDVKFTYRNANQATTLYVYAVSGSDTTLLVNLPNGSWTCDDDSYGDGDPLLVIRNPPSGLYDIWVGTFGSDTAPATLYISEIDPR